MASVEEPPYLTVGTDVSAKYKGAFCEAKITDVNKHVKLRVLFDGGSGTFLIDDTDLKTGSTLETGTRIEAKHPEKKQQTYVQATITKILDHSRYTVVFDDGDQCVLRRNSLCLKSGKHFAESETLDQLPLTNPEHFGNPVKVGAIEQYSNANKVQLNNHSLNDKPKGKSSPSTATNSSTTSEETKFNINNGELNNNRKRQQPPDFSNDTIKKMKKERNATSNNTNSSNSGRRGVAKGRKRRESINNGSKQAVEIDDISIDSSQDSGDATPIETNVKFELIEVGVKLMVQYGKGKVQNVYEAKVNKIETNSTGKVKYFVHYTGWNNRYDEWITRNRILSIVTEKENGLKDGKSKQSEIAQPTQVGISASLSSSSTGLSTNKEKDKEKVKEKDKEKEKDREKEKEKDREKEKDKDKDRDKDKERERDKEKEKDRERDKDKEKEREVPLKTRRGRQADVIVSSVINNSSNSHVSSSTNLVNISSTTSIAPTTTVTTSTTTSSTPNSSTSAPTVTITKDKEKDVPSKTRRSRQSEHIVPGITSMANHNSSCSTSSSTTSVSSTTTSSVVSTSSSTITPSTTNLKEITPVKSRRSKQSETISNTDPIIHQNSNVPAPPDTPVKEKGKQQDNKGKEKNATLKTRRSARPIRKKELIAACTSSVQTSSSSDDDGKKSVKQINNNSNSSCAGSADELSQDNEINLNTTEPTPNLISQDVKPIPQDSDSTELEKHEKSLDDLTNSNHKLQVTPQGPSKSPTHHVSQTLSNELATPDCIRPKQDLDEKTSSLEQTYGELNNVLTSPNTRPIYKFCENIEESDCDKKISILQERIMALRQTYNSLKTELNDLDRRRKRPRTERMNPETSNCSVACRN